MARPSDPHSKIDLLRAAEALFVERGLEHARVEEITTRAGKSKGAFYLHFASKEDAFRQIVESLVARMSACVERKPPGPPAMAMPVGGAAALIEEWRAFDVEIFEFLWQNRGVMRLLLEGGGGASYTYLIDEFADRTRANAKRFFAWGIEAGVLRADLDLEVASLVVSGAWDRVVRSLVVRGERKPDFAALVVAMQRILMGGLAGPVTAHLFDPTVKNQSSGRAGSGGGGAGSAKRPRASGRRSQ